MVQGGAGVVAGEPPPKDALYGALRPAILTREAPRTTTRMDDELRPSGVRSDIAPQMALLTPDGG